jgi:CBS domain-containing protein
MKFMLITILTNEDARHKGKPVHEALLEAVVRAKAGARCMVTRGMSGCYENGEVSSDKVELLSLNMPVKVEILLPAAELAALLPVLEGIVSEGSLDIEEKDLRVYKARNRLIPKQLKVRDAMTAKPVCVRLGQSAGVAVRLLLGSRFHSLPVVNDSLVPVGIITQDDLIKRAGLPVRLGLVALFEHGDAGAILGEHALDAVEQIMTQPVRMVAEGMPLEEAAEMMLKGKLKRFPVVDASGALVGMLARYDILHTISRLSPDWAAIRAGQAALNGIRTAKDITQREAHTIAPGASIQEVIDAIDSNGIQRLAVVDPQGRFLGIIFDQDVLSHVIPHIAGLWDHLAARLPFKEIARRHAEKINASKARTAADLMKTGMITVQEDCLIDSVVKLLAEKGIKRLPVVDRFGTFKGMLSRDAVLRAGLAGDEGHAEQRGA